VCGVARLNLVCDLAVGGELSALYLIAYKIGLYFGFDILSFISRIIELLYISFSSYRYNKNNQTAQLRDSHIILE